VGNMLVSDDLTESCFLERIYAVTWRQSPDLSDP
jgi:hypothetical protein